MGADAEIVVFDYDRYRDLVVPRLVELIGGAAPAPWFDDLANQPDQFFGPDWEELVATLREQPVDLARHCTLLGADLRHLGPPPASRRLWNRMGREEENSGLRAEFRGFLSGRPTSAADAEPELAPWEQVRCRTTTCPESSRCLLHERAGEHASEALHWLYEAMVVDTCVVDRGFIGRNANLNDFWPVLRSLGVPAGDRMLELFDRLGSRGAAIGHTDGPDGIHGWLTPEEAAELAARLDPLPLPVIEPGKDALGTYHGAADHGPEFTWPHVTLAYVRKMAHRAATDGHGLLFGQDIASAR